MHSIRTAVTGIVGFLLAATSVSGQAALINGTQQARAAIAARDAATAIRVTDSLIAGYPDHPNVTLMRARALVIASRPDDAERALRRLFAWDPRYVRFALTDSVLKPLAPRLENLNVEMLAAKADSPVSTGMVWATIGETDLVPEGTAYDPATRSVLIGSLNKNRIVAISPDGKATDRVTANDSGLGSVVGIHVDSARGTLWVASNRRFDTPTDSSRSALFAFDAATGKFRRKVMSTSAGPTFLNDITTDKAGNVYVTDTQGGEVWTLRAGDSVMTRYAPIGKVHAPNGITVSSDGNHLYVGDVDHIQVVDLGTGTTWRIAVPDSLNVAGIDGLAYHDGGLIAHHPISFWRIARYELDAGNRRITGRKLIEQATADSRTSTTGEVVGDQYFYIGNSQIDRMNARTIDAAKMDPIRIYRAPAR